MMKNYGFLIISKGADTWIRFQKWKSSKANGGKTLSLFLYLFLGGLCFQSQGSPMVNHNSLVANYDGILVKNHNNGYEGSKTTLLNFEISVSGKVVDSNGQPIPGATVSIPNSGIGTATDLDGNYTLTVPEGSTLVFSFIGFVSQSIEVGNQNVIDVTLIETMSSLDEVLVVGYGTQKKMNLTGSVASISGDEIANRPLPNVGEALSGISPNLNISIGGKGGEPGASRSWNIRGLGSISGDDSPLILVDGVQMDINNLDPQNIESVSVLKDASASAIYGARAPFGVILITTKKGTKGEGVKIQYNHITNIGTTIGIPHMENSLVYAAAYNQASANSGSAPIFADDLIERMRGFQDGTYPYEINLDDPTNSIWAGRRTGNANYDWPHELLKDFKVDAKHSINISGGSDKTQYYVSMGLYDEGGFYNIGYDEYKRYDMLANISTEATDWLRFNFSTKYAKSKTDYPHGITTVDKEYFWGSSLYHFAPNTPKYNPNGSAAQPIYRNIEDAGRIVNNSNDLLVSGKIEIEPIKGWKTNASLNYNVTTMNQESNPKPVWVELGNGDFGNVGKPSAAYESSFSTSPYTLFNVTSSYERSIGSHYFNLLVGYEQEEKSYSWLYARGDDLISTEIPSLSTSLGATTVDDTKWDWATQGVFGRFNYNFQEKYLLEFSARYNGSSRFAPDSRWGFFPSASAGYNVSQENFWSAVEPYINSLKVRASYGALGNQNVASYLYIPSVPIFNETPWIISDQRPSYATTPGLISSGLTWETITTFNLGIDAGFLNNRLELTFDVFNRRTSDMFGPQQVLPYTLGTGTPTANNAKLETKGFELILKWRERVSSNFSYNAQFTLGDNVSTILQYKNDNGLINTWYNGKEVGEIWGFISDGLIQTEGEEMNDQSEIHPNWRPGDMKYKDMNNDGKITYGSRTLDDHGDLVRIGNYSPRFNYGIIGGMNFKGFDLFMQWSGIAKRDFSPSGSNNTFWGLSHSWASSAIFEDSPVLDYWRPADEENMFGPNTDAYFPKPYFSSETNKNKQVQSKYVINASYLRLRNLQLGYTVPSDLSKRVFVQQARVFVSGGNLLTLQKMPRAMDPETAVAAQSSGGIYPIAKTFSLGLNLTF